MTRSASPAGALPNLLESMFTTRALRRVPRVEAALVVPLRGAPLRTYIGEVRTAARSTAARAFAEFHPAGPLRRVVVRAVDVGRAPAPQDNIHRRLTFSRPGSHRRGRAARCCRRRSTCPSPAGPRRRRRGPGSGARAVAAPAARRVRAQVAGGLRRRRAPVARPRARRAPVARQCARRCPPYAPARGGGAAPAEPGRPRGGARAAPAKAVRIAAGCAAPARRLDERHAEPRRPADLSQSNKRAHGRDDARLGRQFRVRESTSQRP